MLEDFDFNSFFIQEGIEELEKKVVSDYILEGMEPLREYIEFSSGKGDLKKWVEKNRIIYGQPFSYENSDPLPSFSDVDKKELKNQIVKDHSGHLKLKFAKRPYLTQYINDITPDKTVIKCRQSEFSETEINENIFLSATIPYYKVRHIFPTAGVSHKMGKEKISPAILKSPLIKKLVRKPYNLTSFEFDSGGFYTVDSSYVDHGGRGPSSDKITFDEYESQNPIIEEVYSESLSHSSMPRKVRISTPLLPGSGIDLMYDSGCQFSYFVKCSKCGHEQVLSFPENIIGFFESRRENVREEKYLKKINKVYIGCVKCAAYIDRNSNFYENNSRWIAKKEHLRFTSSSYRITSFMLPWKTGKEILFKYHTFPFVHQFWNEVIGKAYVDPSSIINREIFERMIDPSFKNQCVAIKNAKNVSIGVDWGGSSGSWVVVRASGLPPEPRKAKVIYIEKICKENLIKFGYRGDLTDHVERLTELIKIFRPKIIVNDANGIGADRNTTIVKRFPTRAYGAFYDTDEIKKQKTKQSLIMPQWNDSAHRVTVSRLYSFKDLIREFEEERISIPQLDPDTENFIQHHCNIVFQKMVDDKGRMFEIVGKTGEDHLCHADNYSKIGFDRLVNNEREGGTVGTISGEKKNKKKSIFEKRKEQAKKISGNPDLD